MSYRLATVIPFFQRKSGILQKAIRSALGQTSIDDFHIIVVDDMSPIPASQEVSCFSDFERKRIRVVRQERNGGPGAARNRGLELLEEEDVEYVAFLDSDDGWLPSHLSNALVALSSGFDFYFADFFQLNQEISAFNRAKRIAVADHPLLHGTSTLHQYKGEMFNQILTGNIIGTSTVVYRFSKFSSLRFRAEYRYAGEDYLFWLELSRRTEKIAFSSACECVYGEGVNIYSGSTWDSETSLECIHDDIKYRKFVLDKMSLNPEQVVAVAENIRQLRSLFIRNVLHRLLQRKKIRKELIYSHLMMDPGVVFAVAPALVEVLRSKVGSRNSVSKNNPLP